MHGISFFIHVFKDVCQLHFVHGGDFVQLFCRGGKQKISTFNILECYCNKFLLMYTVLTLEEINDINIFSVVVVNRKLIFFDDFFVLFINWRC